MHIVCFILLLCKLMHKYKGTKCLKDALKKKSYKSFELKLGINIRSNQN